MTFECHRNFNCGCGIARRRSTASTMTLGLSFCPSSSPAWCSRRQKIGIGDNEARFRIGDRHGPPLFEIEQLVEMPWR